MQIRGKTPYERAMMRTVEGPIVSEQLGPCLDCLYAPNDSGYPLIYDNTRGYSVSANRIVLEHKLGRSIQPEMCALHHCDRPICIRSSHIYEGTVLQNVIDRDQRGRTARQYGEHNAMTKLTTEQVTEMRQQRKNGLRLHVIAKLYGICIPHVSDIVAYKKWKHV